jgi:hypothetical protein
MHPLDRRVAVRHDDIPQDALFDIEAAGDHSEKPRRRYEKSVGKGTCPSCGHDEVGQVRVAVGLAWRDHYRSTIGGARLRCSGSGSAVQG